MFNGPRALMAAIFGFYLVVLPNWGETRETLNDFQRVVILHSFHKGQKWNDDLSTGVADTLNINNIELNFEYMDTIRMPEDSRSRHFEDLLRYKYRNRKVDVVISTDEEALDFILINRRVLFPGATIVYCGIKFYIDRFWEEKLTGIIESVDLLSNIRLAKKLNPDLKRIFVVMDNTQTSLSLINNFITAIRTFSPGISFDFSDFVSFDELLATIDGLSDDSAVFLVNYTNDQSGRVISMEECARRISRHSPVPVYSIWDSYLSQGILGGKLVSGYTQGRMAAEIALRILQGEPVEEIPVQESPPSQYMFDYNQLQKFNIEESYLPADSIIVNLPDTLYRRYKRLILMLVFGCISFSLIIFLLSMNIVYRRRTEKSLKRYSNRLNFLHRIDQSILNNFSLQSIGSGILVPTLKMTECDLIGIFLFERELMPAWGLAFKNSETSKPILNIDMSIDRLPREMVKHNCVVRLGREEIETRQNLFGRQELSNLDMYLLIPLVFRNQPLGVFYLANAESKTIDPDQETVARQIADSLALAIQNNYFLKEIRTHEAKLRHMSLNLLEAQEIERKRISAELHDEFGQTLTGIGINFSVIRKKLDQAPSADLPSGINSRMEEIEQAIHFLTDQIHNLSFALRPPMLEDLGLVPTFRWFLNQFKERNGLEIKFSVGKEKKGPVPGPVAVTMYRVLQEALNNIVKHADASYVTVSLRILNKEITLRVTDDGVGFDISALRFSNIGTRGLGLIGMRERLDLLHGDLKVYSVPKQGTVIQAAAPLTEDVTKDVIDA